MTVYPGDLQRCLSYSLIARLSPRWNKAGPYLICGKDFLTDGGRLNAISLELSTSEGQLCFSVEPSSIRLPPATLEDFGLPPLALRRLQSDPNGVLHPSSATGGALWCHVLPSMKRGQILSFSRRLPPESPFRTYQNLQTHWTRLYGYRLPELEEQQQMFCSVFFRPLGHKLFTYPLSCVRLWPAERCAPYGHRGAPDSGGTLASGLQGALDSFLQDVGLRLKSVCGLQTQLSRTSLPTISLKTARVLNGPQTNLTSSTPPQLPVPPPGERPRSGLQHLAESPLWPQDGASSSSSSSFSSSSFPSSSSSSSSFLPLSLPPPRPPPLPPQTPTPSPSKSKEKPGSKAKSKEKPGSKAKSKEKPGSKPGSKAKSKEKPGSKAKSKEKPGSKPGSKAKSKEKPGSKVSFKAGSKPGAKAKPGSRAGSRSGSRVRPPDGA
ncbi:uncharacterized protein C18orf63 homolog [Menidia menidia]